MNENVISLIICTCHQVEGYIGMPIGIQLLKHTVYRYRGPVWVDDIDPIWVDDIDPVWIIIAAPFGDRDHCLIQ